MHPKRHSDSFSSSARVDRSRGRRAAASRSLIALAVAAACVGASGCAHLAARTPAKTLDRDTRLLLIRRSNVWSRTDVPSMDIKAGPQGRGAFKPEETVVCDYVDETLDGSSPKFACSIGSDKVKVKYGRDNAEVYGEVAATRLLWALGFAADREYPVRVVCRGCPSALRGRKSPEGNDSIFEIAAIERKTGWDLDERQERGWAWPDLDMVDPNQGGAVLAQRDALKLLAVIIQHTDNKPVQQRLVCMTETDSKDPWACPHAFMLINDLGVTFGKANVYNRQSVGGVNLKQWSETRVWRDDSGCVGNLPKSWTGTLDNPRISESGRQFLAGLLTQLRDEQIRDLFEVARFPLRTEMREGLSAADATEAWVSAFKDKIAQVADRTCQPASPARSD